MAASQAPDRSLAGSYFDLVVEIQQRHRDLAASHAVTVADRDRLRQIVEGLLGVIGKFVDVEEVARWRLMAGLDTTKEQRDGR